MAELKRPTISGYKHPENMNYSKQGVYKTFTEGKKIKKEKFGSITVGKQYASYGEYDEPGCPVCKDSVVTTCPCGYSDKKCVLGHIWYTDRDGKIRIGNPHS